MDKDSLSAVLVVSFVALVAVGVLFHGVALESPSGYVAKKMYRFLPSKAEEKKDTAKDDSAMKFLPGGKMPAQQQRRPEFSVLCNRDLYYGNQIVQCEPGINDADLPKVLAGGTFTSGSVSSRYTQHIEFIRSQQPTGQFVVAQDDDDAPQADSYILIDDSMSTPLYRYYLTFATPIRVTDGSQLRVSLRIQGIDYTITDAQMDRGMVTSLTFRSPTKEIVVVNQRRVRVNGNDLDGTVSNINIQEGVLRGFSYDVAPDISDVNELYLGLGDEFVDHVFGGFKFIFADSWGEGRYGAFNHVSPVDRLEFKSQGSVGYVKFYDANKRAVQIPLTMAGVGSGATVPAAFARDARYTTAYGGVVTVNYDERGNLLTNITFEESADQNLPERQRITREDITITPSTYQGRLGFRVQFNTYNPSAGTSPYNNKGFGPVDYSSRDSNTRLFTSLKGTKIFFKDQTKDEVHIFHPRNRIYANVMVASADYNPPRGAS